MHYIDLCKAECWGLVTHVESYNQSHKFWCIGSCQCTLCSLFIYIFFKYIFYIFVYILCIFYVYFIYIIALYSYLWVQLSLYVYYLLIIFLFFIFFYFLIYQCSIFASYWCVHVFNHNDCCFYVIDFLNMALLYESVKLKYFGVKCRLLSGRSSWGSLQWQKVGVGNFAVAIGKVGMVVCFFCFFLYYYYWICLGSFIYFDHLKDQLCLLEKYSVWLVVS